MTKAILQVEDSDDDARLLPLAFRKVGVTNHIITVPSGEEAICYLRGDGSYADRDKFPMPGVLLLDLKLPGASGFEVLKWIRQQSSLNGILILALSGHNEVFQISRAYALGANSFLTKPVNAEDVVHLTKAFQGYWMFDQP